MVSFMFFPKYCAYLLCLISFGVIRKIPRSYNYILCLISFGVIRKIPRSYNYILCLDQLLVMSSMQV